MYSIDTLKEINQSYDYRYRVSQSDVDKANAYVQLIESTRSNVQPKAGDRLRLTTKHGDYYSSAHIEGDYPWGDEPSYNICECPYVPFIGITENKDGIWCSTSGGAWQGVPKDKLRYVGREKKLFCDWGHMGACAGGAMYFEAEVSVWEYAEPNPKYGTYTTKDWNRQYISFCENPKDGSPYRYFGDGMAYKDREDYLAWLKTHKGVEFEGNWPNQTVVFFYRTEHRFVTKEEYLSLDLPVDTRMWNGSICNCKFEYDDENHKIIEYSYGGNCKGGGISSWYCEDLQLDWRTHKPFEYQRKVMGF